MEAIVLPVLQTSLNLPGLIQACKEMSQPNPAQASDQKGLKGLQQTVAVLDEVQRKPYLTGSMVHLGYLFVTWPEDMAMVLSYTRGMPHIYHDGVQNRYVCTIVTGTMDNWVDCCRRACVKDTDQVVRFVFNKVYRDIESKVPIFDRMSRKDNQDTTFLLEHK